ncbi:DNA damage-induced apoptosis suppressor protein [Pungitius pungitius]|uniref:DNA damage-induced apoptosis suppressor protein n=1 Tax=Pungitius pungitius TaxID=134920 RepID=UPI002E123E44
MPAARALVDCVVLSLQTACVFYPSCKDCFSRIEVEQRDTTRCRCFKCGYSCPREQADYRYRLSLKVTRNSCIFGLTVFGTCLNPFFGIHAKGLQRLVENSDGASRRSTLLMKAVEDCFIGRHFIFGIKVPEKESLPWVGAPVANGSSSKETVHFIATEMILPNATGLGGCTVVSYYRMLLQKATEYELASTDSSKTCGPPAATLLLIPHHYPSGSFNHSRLSASDLLSHSPPSSQCQDGTLSPTPPWEQSLGLVTSSAEQEEGCSLLSGGDGIGRRTENQEARPCALRGCPKDREFKEEKAPSPPLSLGCSTPSCPSFSKYEKDVENTSVLNTWISPPLRGHNLSNEWGFSTRRPAHTVLSSSLAWGDLPFSESLSEYLCEENNHLDIVVATEPHLNDLEISSQHSRFLCKSNSVFQSNTQMTDSQSQISLEITNKPVLNGGHRRDLPDQIYKTPQWMCIQESGQISFYP